MGMMAAFEEDTRFASVVAAAFPFAPRLEEADATEEVGAEETALAVAPPREKRIRNEVAVDPALTGGGELAVAVAELAGLGEELRCRCDDEEEDAPLDAFRGEDCVT